MRTVVLLLLITMSAAACSSSQTSDDTTAPSRAMVDESDKVAALLDRFHDAASRADGDTYFGSLRGDGVFIGTDASERWTRDEFRTTFQPYFDDGTGWTYVPRDRVIRTSSDGSYAWFDELLDNEKYGVCRGVGLATREPDGTWYIRQYALSMAIPNDVALDVVDVIRNAE